VSATNRTSFRALPATSHFPQSSYATAGGEPLWTTRHRNLAVAVVVVVLFTAYLLAVSAVAEHACPRISQKTEERSR